MATLYYYVVCNVFSFGEPTHTQEEETKQEYVTK